MGESDPWAGWQLGSSGISDGGAGGPIGTPAPIGMWMGAPMVTLIVGIMKGELNHYVLVM